MGNFSFFPPVAPLSRLRVLASFHHLRHDKMSDRETLLGMGFDPARVDCESVTFRCTPAFTLFPRPPLACWHPFLGILLIFARRGVEGDE